MIEELSIVVNISFIFQLVILFLFHFSAVG